MIDQAWIDNLEKMKRLKVVKTITMDRVSGYGWHVQFKNKYSLSIQIGNFSYCNNGNGGFNRSQTRYCKNAEIAVLDRRGGLIIPDTDLWKGDDSVMGYVSPKEIIEMAKFVSKIEVKEDRIKAIEKL